ncbi:protein NO VEIN domain-containing protein [Candidatus Chloroploca asiatica]|uniref:Helicase n=1 Tax=Candidatus Chloroploca asiatica TaxID=1506545 RepID=A0A2H3KV74_9CHLR|nr:helicase [Candidatus Chloroploca asiatica]
MRSTVTDVPSIIARLKPNVIVYGPMFPERVQIIEVTLAGTSIRIKGEGLSSGKVLRPILTPQQLNDLTIEDVGLFDGDPQRFRLGIEAMRLGLAYEYDPYFSLSIARVDPLPHQLEAVYDYFLKQPRIRFLLADDPGAGKTIMAGLLIKELKIRGLAQRVLIVTPANLTFQWQREMKDRFREQFEIVRGDVLRSTYGSNPWQEKNQVITSISWVSRMDDARESLLRSRWDLIIVDEAHKMSAYSDDKKTLAYQLGEALSEMTDHYLLMTATPHKGDPENFALFLKLLDPDVYGDVSSLEKAIERREAPFYLRRVKEAMVTFPDPQTGEVKTLFTKREVRTIDFEIDDNEWEFYDALTHYVEEQSVMAAADQSARGRAVGFTMAMLQRRFASSVYAVRRSLERMQERREKILADPEAYRQGQITKRMPENFDELPDDEQQQILEELEQVVASVDPVTLKHEIAQIGRLITQASELEQREIESKLVKLKEQLATRGVFADPKMKLLLFTEHRETLDYLVTKLRAWGLTVTQIYGGMPIGDRDTPGSRIYAEREFKDTCQVLVATEAAGEGINLQFCWFMINYDIPWNPVRLEQRMGRIHRYGQEKDCLILNFVSTRTREGRVLQKLFERIREIEGALDPQRTGKVFNVLGDIFPSNQLERMLRDMYARNLTEDVIKSRIVEQVDTERFRRISFSALEGLAKRELNLAAIVGHTAEARERKLVPEVIRDFFLQASSVAGIQVRAVGRSASTDKPRTGPLGNPGSGPIYRVGRIPRTLVEIGEQQEARFGRLGREYKQIAFDQHALKDDATLEWVTPGHPLFEAVREDIRAQTQTDLQRGAIFFEFQRNMPARLDVFSASIVDGRRKELHCRLFVVETALDGTMNVRQPTLFLDLVPAPEGTAVPDDGGLPNCTVAEQFLIDQELQGNLAQVAAARTKEIATIEEHLKISLDALINRQSLRMAELQIAQDSGDESPLLAANLKTTEDRLDVLNRRLERRSAEIEQERHCTIDNVRPIAQAWVLPHPERTSELLAPMVSDPDIERIAVQAVIAYEKAHGRRSIESVEKDNRGFDLISRRLHPENPQTALEVRFIEVKGRALVGEVALTSNEYHTAERLKDDYWLYVVYNCATTPEVQVIRNPARLEWAEVMQVAHYRVGVGSIMKAASTA